MRHSIPGKPRQQGGELEEVQGGVSTTSTCTSAESWAAWDQAWRAFVGTLFGSQLKAGLVYSTMLLYVLR